MTEYQDLISEPSGEMVILEREERCEKAIKTLSKAIIMRLFVTAVLVWAAFRTEMELWVMGLMGLVMLINLSGLLPLYQEWKRRRSERKQIIAEYEA